MPHGHEKTDVEILRESAAAPYLFAILLDRYQDALMRKALSILCNKEDAEDAVQETFVKIYQYAETFEERPGATFSSWAYKILVNTALTRYQKKKRDCSRRAALPPEMYERLPDLSDTSFSSLERREYVVSVLERMPVHLARVLRQHFIEGKSQKEIAETEEASVSAIKTRIHRAKQLFRNIDTALV